MRLSWHIAAFALTLALLASGEKVSASAFGYWQHLVHVVAYALLCAVYACALRRAHWSLTLLLAAGVAIAQELFQALTGHHAFELDDLVYDLIGVMLGTAAGVWLASKVRSIETT